MTDFIDAIDDWTESYMADQNSPESSLHLFGLCELMTNNNQVMPVTIPTRRTQVALNDKKDFITWIRLVNPITSEESPEHDWGLKIGRKQTISLRWVIAHKVSLGEDLIFNLINRFTRKFNVDGYEFSFVGDTINVDADHEAVYSTELGATAYEKHRMNWNIYAISLNIEYVICES